MKTLRDLALLANRLSLGLFFLLAGWQKVTNGVGAFYEKVFLPLKPAWLPDWFAVPYGHAVPFAEVGVGVLLILGLLGRWAAGIAALMLLSFTVALAVAGHFFANAGPFHTNVVFITLAVLLAVLGPGDLSVDRLWRKRVP